MANYDATSTNKSQRNTRIYKDLDLDFGRNVVTNDVNKLQDAEAVKRSVRNLINTSHYERPFHPEIGSDIRATLFEPVSPSTANLLARHVEDCITNFEPRAELSNVIVRGDIDQNRYEVTIEFYVSNSPSELQALDIFLERLR